MTPFPRSSPRLRRGQSGFTLAEMAIVLLVVSILLGGVLMPLSTQMDLRRIGETKRSMDGIKEAMIGFALANGRLPCPASPTAIDGVTATAGTELFVPGAACTAIVGVIPWVTLNVPETDEWGRRFTYRVTTGFADVINTTAGCTPPGTPPGIPIYASFALCDSGDMRVFSRDPASKATFSLTSFNLPAVFISHGKNGWGGFTSKGTVYAAVPPSNVDETANAAATTPTTLTFYSRDKMDLSTGCNDAAGTTPMCEFDDLVAWIPLTTLMNRMVVSGKLP